MFAFNTRGENAGSGNWVMFGPKREQLTGGCLNLLPKMYELYLSLNISAVKCVSCKWDGCAAGVGKGTR